MKRLAKEAVVVLIAGACLAIGIKLAIKPAAAKKPDLHDAVRSDDGDCLSYADGDILTVSCRKEKP